MATGIVSIAAHLAGLAQVARALLAVNIVAYVTLWALTLLRVGWHPSRVAADLADHDRGPGFFTTVAGTGVLGRQLELLTGDGRVPMALWALAIALWVGLTYVFLTAVIARARKPGPETGASGTWLLLVVATQSIAVLGALLVGRAGAGRDAMILFVLAMYLLGAGLYGIIIAAIFQRLVFLPLSASALAPSYWINMGAVAITTLAGSTLLLEGADWALLRGVRPFVTGLTLLSWATATWWIPLLAGLGVWRHGVERVPLSYDPQYWSLVFPLGMYGVGTLQLARAADLPFLLAVAGAFAWLALAAWAATFVGLLRRLASRGVGFAAAGVPARWAGARVAAGAARGGTPRGHGRAPRGEA
jgi:tellurite resistance protein TehA-like permease